MKAGLRRRRTIVAAAGRAEPASVAGTDSIGARSLARPMTRTDLSGSVGRTTNVAGLSKKERVSRSVLVALAEAIIVAHSVRRTLRTAERRTNAVKGLGDSGADGLALCSSSECIALTDRSVALQTAHAAKITRFAKTVCTGSAGQIALFRPERFQGTVDALSLASLRIATVAQCAGAGQGVQWGLCEVKLVSFQGFALQESVVVLFDAYQITRWAQKLNL